MTRAIVVHINTARKGNPQQLAKQTFRERFRLREWSCSSARGKLTAVRKNLIQRVYNILTGEIPEDDTRLPVELQGFIIFSTEGVRKAARRTLCRDSVLRSFDILERKKLIQRIGGKGGIGKGGRRNSGLFRILYHPGLKATAGLGLPEEVRERPTSEIVAWLGEQKAKAMKGPRERPRRRIGVLKTSVNFPEGAHVEAQIYGPEKGEVVSEITGKKAKSKCVVGTHKLVPHGPHIEPEVPPQQLALPGILTRHRDDAELKRKTRHRRDSSVTKLQGARMRSSAAGPGTDGGRLSGGKKRSAKTGDGRTSGPSPGQLPFPGFQSIEDFQMGAAAEAVAIAPASMLEAVNAA